MTEPDKVLETRTLDERVRVLARRYDAIAIGFTKRFRHGDKSVSVQDISNAQRDALILWAAATALKNYEQH